MELPDPYFLMSLLLQWIWVVDSLVSNSGLTHFLLSSSLFTNLRTILHLENLPVLLGFDYNKPAGSKRAGEDQRDRYTCSTMTQTCFTRKKMALKLKKKKKVAAVVHST